MAKSDRLSFLVRHKHCSGKLIPLTRLRRILASEVVLQGFWGVLGGVAGVLGGVGDGRQRNHE